MTVIGVAGIRIAYELIGQGNAPVVVITPGGRFSKDAPGLRELGEAIVAGGLRALIWDRPNCGASDVSFVGESESDLHVEALIGLIQALGIGPVILAGGSAGARIALMAAARRPEIARGLVIWWISGGPLGLAGLAVQYGMDSAMAALRGGMAAVAAAPGWAEQVARNPRNREIILAQDVDAFVETMQRWAAFFVPDPGSPVPGMTPADFTRLTMPVTVFRSGRSDVWHPRRTSEQVHALIPQAILREPPWFDQEFNDRIAGVGEGRSLFANWPALAPDILRFAALTLPVPAIESGPQPEVLRD